MQVVYMQSGQGMNNQLKRLTTMFLYRIPDLQYTQYDSTMYSLLNSSFSPTLALL